jgi:hypothetical protein
MLPQKVSLSYLEGFLKRGKILRYGADGFTFPPKQSLLRNFIAIKNPSNSPGIETANLGSNGKHANH